MQSGCNENSDVKSIITSDEFCSIWREANQRCIDEAEYSAMPMPAGIAPKDMHEIVETLLCASGIQLPFKPYIIMEDPPHVWISMTSEVRSLLEEIDRLSNASSEATHRLMTMDQFLQLPLMFDELVKIGEMDGFAISKERARMLWFESAAPATADDRAFLNLCKVFLGTDVYGERDISRGFIEYVHEMFEVDLAGSGAAGVSRSSTLFEHTRQYTNRDYYDEDKTLAAIVSVLRDDSIPPVLGALQTQLFMLNLSPFERFNHSTSLILHKIFFEQAGVPLLAFVPFTLAIESWNNGKSDTDVPDVEPLLIACKQCKAVGLDATPYEVGALKIIANELVKLSNRIDASLSRLKQIGEKIRVRPDLNMRQKATLLVLLKHPKRKFTIKDYRIKHGISNSTARQDLIELVDMGYLSMSRKSKGETALIKFTIGSKLLMLSIEHDA